MLGFGPDNVTTAPAVAVRLPAQQLGVDTHFRNLSLTAATSEHNPHSTSV
jgi:hypothetical protein